MIAGRKAVVEPAEALALAGACLAAAGLALAAGALAGTDISSTVHGLERIVVGLRRVQLSQMLTLTVGLWMLAIGLTRGAGLGGWREPAARTGAGVAVGAALVAIAVIVASVYVALGGASGELAPAGDGRVLGSVRQAVAAAGFGAAWLVAAARLLDIDVPSTPPIQVTAAVELQPQPSKPETASARAREIYQERLAFSPRATVAQALVDEIARLEAEGDEAAAERLVARLQAL